MNDYEYERLIGKDVTFFHEGMTRMMGTLVNVNEHTITIDELGHRKTFEIATVERFECTSWGQ